MFQSGKSSLLAHMFNQGRKALAIASLHAASTHVFISKFVDNLSGLAGMNREL